MGLHQKNESEPEPDRPGELGGGDFRYACVNHDDPVCPAALEAEEFPDQIGVGSLFDVSFVPVSDSDEPQSAVEVSSGSETYISDVGDAFRANQAGLGVLIARRTVDTVAVDFLHVTLAEVGSNQISGADGSTPRVLMAPDEEQEHDGCDPGI